MAIHSVAEPANGSTLVRTSLERVMSRPSPLSGRGLDFKTIQLAAPHAVYDLRADEVAAGEGLASAHRTGFRYLVTAGGTAVAAAEVLADDAGTAKLVANINYGPFVEATARGLTEAASLPAATAGSYEMRLLRFAAIGLMALWLKPEAGGADILYPLAPVPAGLQAERPYTEADLLGAIRPLAERRASKLEKASVP
ncbi:MAG TPA: hypothetical protein VGF96_02585 [Terracidiphilus sp.]|jgi:hypothetical protein